MNELTTFAPPKVSLGVLLAFYAVLPALLGIVIYAVTLYLVGILFGGWTLATRWPSGLVMLGVTAVAYVQYLWCWHIAAGALARYIDRRVA